jgi:hypothetical protein
MSLLKELCKEYRINYFRNILRRITRSGLELVWIILAIAERITGVAVLVGIGLGLALGIPALALYLAWNWAVPVFGGPAIGYWTAVGLIILLGIVGGLIRK